MNTAATATDEGEYDVIIVGGGTAGCVLANRLSADPQLRVFLLEAGGEPDSRWFRVPVGYRFTIGNPTYDWNFEGEPEPGLKGRRLRHPRGKVLGGSTAINGMVAIRGQAADYDSWRALGLPGWGWSEVLPYFKQSEDHVLGAGPMHGSGGEWSVQAARVHWPVLDDVQSAAAQAGLPTLADFNTGDNEGVGPIHVNQRGGRRWSASDAYLAPVRARRNLRVVSQARVDTLSFSGRRVSGVRWRDSAGGSHAAQARGEVILAAGAFGSPELLLRSGIGPAEDLQDLGIEMVAHVPGVGHNLHDHLQIALRWRLDSADTLNAHMNSPWRTAIMGLRYLLTKTGPLTMAPCQLGLFARSRPDVDRADLGWNVLAFSRPSFDAKFDPFPGLTLISYDLRPTSRGHIRLASPDPAAPPRIRMNYLQTERDGQVMVEGMRWSRRLMASPAMARHRPQEQWPGPSVSSDDDAALLDLAREKAGTIFHPVGSARMGPGSDPMAVCDAQLRVRGVDGLRVIDASVMPTIVSGNTASPTVMIAEKGAAIVSTALRRL